MALRRGGWVGPAEDGAPPPALVAVGIVGLSLLGLGAMLAPLAAAGCLLAGGGFAAMVLAPSRSYLVFLLLLIATPAYLVLPSVPGLPPLPVSVLMLGLLTVAALGPRLVDGTLAARPHAITLAFAGYGAALLLSILPSHDAAGLNGFVRCFGIPFAVYAVTRVCLRPARVGQALDVLLCGAVLASLYGCVEFVIRWNPLIEKLTEQTGDAGDLLYWDQSSSAPDMGQIYRSFSFETNPLYFGCVVSMLFPYAVVRFGAATGRRASWIYGGAAALSILGVLTTASRGPLLSLGVTSILLAVLVPRVRSVVLRLAGAGGVAVLCALPWLGTQLSERLSDSDNVTLRFKLWEICWRMFLDHPVLGVGINRFTSHQLEVLRRYEIGPFPEEIRGDIASIGTADNTVAQLAAETGLLGVGTFLGLMLAGVLCLLRAYRTQDIRRHDHALAISAGILAYWVNGMTITAYTAYAGTAVLAVFLALAVALDPRINR